MNRYKITYIVDKGETETTYITERTEAAARKVFRAASKGGEITDVELDDTDVPATKEQERETLSKIKQMVEELGPQSYIAAAFEGCFDVAEQNIEDDFACSMKQRAETAEQQLAYNQRELDDAKKRLKELGGLVDSLKEENRSLGLRLTRSVRSCSLSSMRSSRTFSAPSSLTAPSPVCTARAPSGRRSTCSTT